MKKILLSTIVFVLLVMLSVSATAEVGDYGYYDRNLDGKVEVSDALGILKQVLNGDTDATLLPVLQTLKITTSGEIVRVTVKSLDYDANTANIFFSSGGNDYEVTLPFSKLGLDRVSNAAFFEQGIVTMTVPSPALDFFAAFDAKKVYAAKVENRYETSVLELTVNDTVAMLDGVETTLIAAPIMSGNTVMIPANTVKDFFEAEVSWNSATSTAYFKNDKCELVMTLDSTTAIVNGTEQIADAPLIIVGSCTYVPAEFVSVALGANVIFEEEIQTMTIARQFYPTVYLDSVSGAAGEEITVTAYIKNNPGTAGFEFKIGYDSSVMTYVSGKSLNNNFYIATTATAGANPAKVVGANLSLKNIKGDLTVATITFKIADNAVNGDYELAIQDFKAYDSNIIGFQVRSENSTLTVN